jgi:hypothetical protein
VKAENKLRLERLVEKYECEAEEVLALDAEKARKKQKFLQEFELLKAEAIIPVMKEIGGFLKAAGHDYRIQEKPEFYDLDGTPRLGIVEMEIIPGRLKDSTLRSPNEVCYSCVASHDGKVITGTRPAGGTHKVQPIAEYTIDQLSAGLVEDQIMNLLETTLSGVDEPVRFERV